MSLTLKILGTVCLWCSTAKTESFSTKGQMSTASYFNPVNEIVDIPSCPSLVSNQCRVNALNSAPLHTDGRFAAIDPIAY